MDEKSYSKKTLTAALAGGAAAGAGIATIMFSLIKLKRENKMMRALLEPKQEEKKEEKK